MKNYVGKHEQEVYLMVNIKVNFGSNKIVDNKEDILNNFITYFFRALNQITAIRSLVNNEEIKNIAKD